MFSVGRNSADAEPPFPAAATDKIAEAFLACLCLLLKRCPVQSPDQLLELLQRMSAVVALQKSASEEVGLAIPQHQPDRLEGHVTKGEAHCLPFASRSVNQSINRSINAVLPNDTHCSLCCAQLYWCTV